MSTLGWSQPLWVGLVLLSSLVFEIQGHGRLMEPVSRASAWRRGYPNPADYNDNQGYCGGYSVWILTVFLKILPVFQWFLMVISVRWLMFNRFIFGANFAVFSGLSVILTVSGEFALLYFGVLRFREISYFKKLYICKDIICIGVSIFNFNVRKECLLQLYSFPLKVALLFCQQTVARLPLEIKSQFFNEQKIDHNMYVHMYF